MNRDVGNNKKANNIQDFIEYYFLFNRLAKFHKRIFNKTAPDLPVLFTEGICMILYKMSKSRTRKYDALKDNKRIEIKATSSKSGQTSIKHNSTFDFLYWMYFNFEDDSIYVTKMPYERFEKDFEKAKLKEGKERINITLKKYVVQTDEIDIFKILENNSIEKVEILRCCNNN